MQRFLVSACLLGACSVVAFAQGPPEGPFRPGMKGPIPIRVGDGLPPKANDSHLPRPGEELMPDIRDLLSGSGKTPKDIDPKMLQDLMNKLPKDQKFDPKLVENLLKNNPQFRDPEFLKQLQKMLDAPDFAKNLQQQLGNGEGPKPKLDNIGDIANKFNEVVKQGKDPNLGNLDPLNPNPLNPNNLPNNPLENQAMNNDWVKWFDKSFGDSDLTKDLAKDLADALGNTELQGLMKEFPELNSKEWKDFGDWTKLNLKPGDLPDFKMGGSSNTSGGGSSFNGFGGSSTGSGSSGGSGGGSSVNLSQGAVTALVIILCVFAALIGAFVFYRKYQSDKEHQAALAALGKAGLDLTRIRTREELVAAFEAVTLKRMGDDARNWNHRVIADQFAETEPTHTEPANEVAELYERARYAPEDENLAPHEYADASRDLTVIAGAKA